MDSENPFEYHEYEAVAGCPLCKDVDHVIVDSAASVVECRGCGHRYVNPRPTQGEIARGYGLPTSYQDWMSEAGPRRRLWTRRFRRVLGGARPGALLDVGAGIGTFLAIARDAGWSVTGTEVSRAGIALARSQYGLDICLGAIEQAPVEGPFDAVTLWHVLEHLPNPDSTLKHVHRLLRDDGILVLALPNDGAAAWFPTAMTNLGRRLLGRSAVSRYQRLRPGVESHIQHFDEKSIQRALVGAGFHVESIAVDDAAPRRSSFGTVAYHARRFLTAATPFNFGREILVTARPRVVSFRTKSSSGVC